MLQWSIREIDLPLKFTWAIARNSSNFKKNFIVTAKSDGFMGEGEVAPNIRFMETSELIVKQFNLFLSLAQTEFPTVQELNVALMALGQKLEESGQHLSMALRFAIEAAYWQWLAAFSGRSAHELLGQRVVHSVHTSFSLPIMPTEEMDHFIKKYNLQRFSSLKLKINSERPAEKVEELRRLYKGKIRIDANEAFTQLTPLLAFLERIRPLEIEFVEQPFPAHFHQEYLDLHQASPLLIFADESVLAQPIDDYFVPRFDGVVIKLMKSGGLLNAQRQIQQARQLGLYTMLGCMIETSLAISHAMLLADRVDFFDLDGMLIVEKDPFNYLFEEKGRLISSHLH